MRLSIGDQLSAHVPFSLTPHTPESVFKKSVWLPEVCPGVRRSITPSPRSTSPEVSDDCAPSARPVFPSRTNQARCKGCTSSQSSHSAFGAEQRRAREARRDATVLGAEDRPKVLHVEVVVGDVVDVLGADPELRELLRSGDRTRGAMTRWSRSGTCAARRAKKGVERAPGTSVGIEEERLELAALEELHEQAPVREDDERRRRERRAREGVLRRVRRDDDGQRAHGDGAGSGGEAITHALGRGANGAQAGTAGPDGPGGVEVGDGRHARRDGMRHGTGG